MAGIDGGRISRHEQAVIQAEMRRLARSLGPYRVLHRDALRRVAGAEHWHDVGFDRALAAAVRTGAVEPLPYGFYRGASRTTTGQSG
jgi:hypothetical protein